MSSLWTLDQTQKTVSSHISKTTADHEKPYPCQDCGKGFLTKTTYDEHMNVHTGEKPSSVYIVQIHLQVVELKRCIKRVIWESKESLRKDKRNYSLIIYLFFQIKKSIP